jgi:peptidoglycan/LPS O-acetylase OafA/YrhL
MAFCFFAGIALCRCFQLLSLTPIVARLVTACSAAATVVCLSVDSLGVFAVFGFAGLIFGLAYQTGTINELLSSRPAMFLGKISFSFYMVHYIPLDLFLWLTSWEKWQFGVGTKITVLAALAVIAFLLSVATYVLVEVPFQGLGRRVSAAVVARLSRKLEPSSLEF